MSRSARARRGFALVAALLVLSGCGADDPPSRGDAAAEGGAFPVTVEHKFGATTVRSTPRRIAVVGLTEQDTVLALGSKPIATTEWYGKQPHAVWPWARKALGDAKPTVLSNADGFQFERIALDVILFATEKPRDIDALEKVPTFGRLDAVAEHRAVFTDGVLTGAAYFMTPLSLPYVLDRLVPQLQAAVAGKAPRRIVDTTG